MLTGLYIVSRYRLRLKDDHKYLACCGNSVCYDNVQTQTNHIYETFGMDSGTQLLQKYNLPNLHRRTELGLFRCRFRGPRSFGSSQRLDMQSRGSLVSPLTSFRCERQFRSPKSGKNTNDVTDVVTTSERFHLITRPQFEPEIRLFNAAIFFRKVYLTKTISEKQMKPKP